MRYNLLLITAFMLISALTSVKGQDYIEREYFPNARAKNASIAAARYAEEGYYYSKFTTYVSAINTSRLFADTCLFFVKRSLMLADTALYHAPVEKYGAIEYLKSGKQSVGLADAVIRDFYSMVDLNAHHYFGAQTSLYLSNGVMNFFNASLLFNSDSENEQELYEVLAYEDEILRLEADETAYQMAANDYENEIAELDAASSKLQDLINTTPDQGPRFQYRTKLDKVEAQLADLTGNLEDTSNRIQEIRQLLDRKMLAELKDVPTPKAPAYLTTSTNPSQVVIDEAVPSGLVYKVQLGYYPSNVNVEQFHGLFPITGETVRGDQMRFYAGLFYNYSEASKGSDYVRNNAIANAFVVPFYNGQKINVSRAVEIEKQLAAKRN